MEADCTSCRMPDEPRIEGFFFVEYAVGRSFWKEGEYNPASIRARYQEEWGVPEEDVLVRNAVSSFDRLAVYRKIWGSK